MTAYAVGDIQGCFNELEALLKKVNFGKRDKLWMAGDLVNRGIYNVETLRFAHELGDRARIVLGNHDLHLLACWHEIRPLTRKDTFYDVLAAPDCDMLLQWLQQQPLLQHSDKHNLSMVHAGIPPIWDIATARARANEVEAALRNKKQSRLFFKNMYGNEPSIWSDTLEGTDRLRVITNYFTRMRFCTPSGSLDFDDKGNTPPSGFEPWFNIPSHLCKNNKVLFGHWAALMGSTGKPNAIAIDTGCIWGGKLTLYRLKDGVRFSVKSGTSL